MQPTESATPGEPIQQLEQFCMTILQAIRSGGWDGMAARSLCSELNQVLHSGMQSMGTELQRELEIVDATIWQLQRLGETRFGEQSRTSETLLAELTRTQRFASGMIQALRIVERPMLAGNQPRIATPAREDASPIAALQTNLREMEAISELPLQVEPLAISLTELCQRAEQHRKKQEYEQAENLYTQVLEREPNSSMAYAGRGLVYLLAGLTEDAILDFTQALRLGDDAECYSRRGDAYSRNSDFAAAVTDYRKALAMEPDLLKVRFNLGLCLRRLERNSEAAEELCLVLKAKPDHALAHYHRGSIQLERLDYTQAIAHFNKALKYKPDLEIAKSQLQAALEKLQQSQAVPERSIAPAMLKLADLPKQELPAQNELPPKPESLANLPTTAPTRPPSQANDRPNKLPFQCPNCKHTGTIAWTRLDKILACPQCHHHFGVKGDGKTVEVSRTASGWIESQVQRANRSRSRKQWFAAVVILLCLVPTLGYSMWKVSRPNKPAVAQELPKDLKARADLFARAWLRNDVPMMRRLTAPSQDRLLYPWYTKNRPAIVQETGIRESLPSGVAIDVQVPQAPTESCQCVVQFTGLEAVGGSANSIRQSWTWQAVGDTWYFNPVPK